MRDFLKFKLLGTLALFLVGCGGGSSDNSSLLSGENPSPTATPTVPQPSAIPEPSIAPLPTVSPVTTPTPSTQPSPTPTSTTSPPPVARTSIEAWKQFVRAKNSGEQLPFPDFSYAGFKQGEEAIPNPSWQQFDVTDFGAKPNDNKDDLASIKDTIAAAQKADGAIVFFPKGRYLLSEQDDIYDSLININGSKLILRGEGSGVGGTELFFREHLLSRTPEKMWTTPPMISINGSTSSSSGNKITNITRNAKIGDFHITVANASALRADDNIIINLKDPKAATDDALQPYKVEDNWTEFKEGEFSREFHKINSISGNTITLTMPLAMNISKDYNWELRKITLSNNFGIENIAFVGNWKEKFQHHKSIIHDSAWTAIRINKYENSWLKDIRFKDWNQTLSINASHSFSVINSLEEGNRGHQSILVQNSYGVLVTHSHDKIDTGMHHAFGVASRAAATVFHRSSWPKETTFDSHASFPHATLFDRIDGGFSGASGGHGGSDKSQPNHMHDLVFWNFKDLGNNDGITRDWWRTDSIYSRFLEIKMIGWHGARANFLDPQLTRNDSYGRDVNPESLYEAQLELRLGKLPNWLNQLNKEAKEK